MKDSPVTKIKNQPQTQSSGYTIIVAEKPAAARKLCDALADPKTVREYKHGRAAYYEIRHNGHAIMVVPAVGHIFGLAEANKQGWIYPVFETKWVTIPEIEKTKAEYVQDYIDNFKELSASATDYIVATDFDIEGAVIGFNVLKFACGVENGKRMHFSTLTKKDLLDAFENASDKLDFPQIEAGLARHELDWIYGINMTRAMTTALKRAGRWSVISTGRVQGPTLAILARREIEIKEFKPQKFWVIELKCNKKEEPDTVILAVHEADKFDEKDKAESVLKKTEGKPAKVAKITKSKKKSSPPTPFNLTKLQTEAYRHFGASPSITQNVAQSLYEKALISYPRTSSEKLPEQLDLPGILRKISGQEEYAKTANEILAKKEIKPFEGEKTDPAHPAIHPTGEVPKGLNDREKKIYDLVVHRFLAVFGEPAIRESMAADIDVNGETFKASGIRTIKPGWMDYYGKYAKMKDENLPTLEEGELLHVISIDMLEKETQPPARFNEASLIKLLEKENLGTKSTRADAIKTLYNRQYINGKKITVSDLGLSVVKALSNHVPKIISVELTREFEEDLEKIQDGRTNRQEVISKARKYLTELLGQFKSQEMEIGKELVGGLVDSQEKSSLLGPCPKCGGTLKKFFNRMTKKQFVGCSGYPTCKNSYPLPAMAYIEPTGKICEFCTTPIIMVKRAGRRPWTMCLDPKCKTKESWGKPKETPVAPGTESVLPPASAESSASPAAPAQAQTPAASVITETTAAAAPAKRRSRSVKPEVVITPASKVKKAGRKSKSAEIATVDDTG